MTKDEEIKRVINEITEEAKKYPKMWTVDVIKLLNHLLTYQPNDRQA